MKETPRIVHRHEFPLIYRTNRTGCPTGFLTNKTKPLLLSIECKNACGNNSRFLKHEFLLPATPLAVTRATSPPRPAAYTLLAAIHGSNVVVCPAAVIHPTIARSGGRLDTARALRYPTSVGTVAALKDGRWTFQDGQDKRNTAAAPIFTSHDSDLMFTYFECKRCNEHDFRNYTEVSAAEPFPNKTTYNMGLPVSRLGFEWGIWR